MGATKEKRRERERGFRPRSFRPAATEEKRIAGLVVLYRSGMLECTVYD